VIAALLILVAQDPAETAKELRAIRDKVAPSVVAIEVARSKDPEGESKAGPSGTDEDYYSRPAGPTTATVLSEDGYLLTSSFNVSGEILRITVTTADGRRHEAKRLGWDGKLDIALLKIDAKDLHPLPRAKLEDAKPGDFVCVVGRAPEPASPTINLGILSALGRQGGTAVQTDAEINYGNAGGPLVNVRGELVGIVCHVRPLAAWGQSGGVGFATKMAEIDKVLEELKKGRGEIAKGPKGAWIGIVPAEPREGVEGVIVDQIMPNSPAEEAGLDAGDVIVGFDGAPVKNLDGFKAELAKKPAGVDREMTIRRLKRDGKTWEEKKLKIKPIVNPE
jgi:S1-C subfamily serine protease